MSIKLDDYFDRDTFSRLKAAADQRETPFLVVDLKTIDRAYDELVDGFPFAKVYYAVKANPANEVLSLLRDKGSNFDIASIYELEKVLACLISSSKAEDALPTLGKLIGNVAKDPGNAKFRRLRLGNPKIKAVVAAPGAADLLALVGFVPEQGSFGGYFNERWLVLPEGDDGSRAHDAASLIWSVLLPQGGAPAPAAAAKDPLDRFWQVFLPSEGVMRIELPDSFFQRSPLEIKLEYQKRKADSATNGKLLTKAMREKYAKKTPVYRSCVLRVRVPAGHYVQSVFTPQEKLRDAYRFVAAAMQTAPTAFDLFAHPSRTPLPDSEGEALRDAGLVPAAILNFKWKGEPAGALRPDMLEAAVPLQAGAQSWI